MQINTLIQASTRVTALSCFAALSISLPIATDPSLRSELALNAREGGDSGGADFIIRLIF